ncbi:unnamed protein product [Triticum turgidum subsp. durum]|uniref:15-cis-phytoene synthase n=1 Tax=Triticum turgidum subsp. durum TaxID=4567 RepID=A0A9R1AG39_TRITD|nr:unnamed protein product [Triticum turgidum subsp. durum]
MTPERRKAVWAIYVWCRRTDELVDGPNSSYITPKALDRWEKRLEDLFEGRPYDMYDAALSDTASKFPIDIQPFRDMIEGMRLDLWKSRYRTFDELYLYCYYVAGTVGLMTVPVMGIAPDSKASAESVYNAALALGIANQLTNILRDVGEDSRRGRIYLPLDELAQAGLTEEDIFRGKVTDKWRRFMKGQIQRARLFFDEAEKGVMHLDSASRWPSWHRCGCTGRSWTPSRRTTTTTSPSARTWARRRSSCLYRPRTRGRLFRHEQRKAKRSRRSDVIFFFFFFLLSCHPTMIFAGCCIYSAICLPYTCRGI